STLRELAERVKRSGSHVVEGHFRRHDFSRWIADQFGDSELANTVRALESEYGTNAIGEKARDELAAVIDQRYESDSERF
ncbi:MAG TPA: hypothetical protein VEI07_08760, partial [Planctomycetaceae bacterium]|nr:hypothetical protein [Planctomycetaceae bacterium]